MRILTLGLIIGVATMMPSTVWATKVWVENKTDKPLKVKFSGAGLIPQVPKNKVRFGDNIAGLKLEWFKINDREVKVPEKLQEGRFWYLYIQKRPFDLAEVTLYRVNPKAVEEMHGGGLFARIFTDILTLGIMEAMWQPVVTDDLKYSAAKGFFCVMTGVIDKQGTIYTTYDEKFVANISGTPIIVHLTTKDNKKFDKELADQTYEFFDTVQPMASIRLDSSLYGQFIVTPDMLKNSKYFIVLNCNPYQVATFKDVTTIDLFDSMQKKLEKYVKANPALARTMDIKYFINNTPKPIDIEMQVADHKTQKATIAAQNVDILAAPAIITSLEFNNGETKVKVDSTAAEKFNGFYITDLKEKSGILYMSLKAEEFKFPAKLSVALWWQGSVACEKIGEEPAKK